MARLAEMYIAEAARLSAWYDIMGAYAWHHFGDTPAYYRVVLGLTEEARRKYQEYCDKLNAELDKKKMLRKDVVGRAMDKITNVMLIVIMGLAVIMIALGIVNIIPSTVIAWRALL